MTVGWLPAPVEELFGPEATAEESYEVLTVDVPPTAWLPALETARDSLGCTYFDWLSAVDEPGTGFRVAAHVVALSPVRRLLVRTTVPHSAPVLATAVSVYAGAGWHERETHEMFGVTFEGHPGLDPLLLPEGFEGHPLRKDFVLAARVAKAWPGAKEPGESDHGGPKRRQMLPPGVPDPNEWGPLKGQLPPAPARPARGAARAAGDRPVRRARTAGEGSASQTTTTGDTGTGPAAGATNATTAAAAGAQAPTPPRRARSAGQGSASQQTEAPAADEQAPSAAAPAAPGTAEPTPPAGPRRTRSASQGSATQRTQATEQPPAAAAPRSSDAPWHHARPAFDEPQQESKQAQEQAQEQEPKQAQKPESRSESEPGATPEPAAAPSPAPEATSKPPASPESDSGPDSGSHPDSTPTPEDPAPEDPAPEDPAPEDPTPRNPAGGTQ
ncbi:dehydrogenase [Streptomyces mirabilis]|uniref:NADH-quinone oxidoreductase subunit C n=1 Tax=Streptomyces mirabilis TaxID=68239 RepID=UPI00167DA50D|nr:NADH-quinone oxidoreductase subunit C [Streptomyces mirabilis]GHD50738.1 dehydrogenase [Streptomyces mirabilis]